MNKLNIDCFEGINRAERTQHAIVHLLYEINEKLDKLMPVEPVIVEAPITEEKAVEEIKEVLVKKAKKTPKKKEVK